MMRKLSIKLQKEETKLSLVSDIFLEKQENQLTIRTTAIQQIG